MPTRGRPTKYGAEVSKRVLDALGAGNVRRASAAYAGISEDTFARWMARYADFADAVLRAEAQAEVMHVATIAQAARAGSWQASVFWLERRRHADWGKIDRLEVEIHQTATRIAAQTGADPDWLVKRAVEIAAEAEIPRGER